MEEYNCSIEILQDDESLVFSLKIYFVYIGILTSFFAAVSCIPKCNLQYFRMLSYAMIANGLQITAQLVFPDHDIFGAILLKNGSSWELTCKRFGFVYQVLTWMGNLGMTLWVNVYLIYLLIKKKRIETAQTEIVCLAFCFVVPLFFNFWIPFLNSYSGWSWCLIMMAAKKGCSIPEGLTYIIVLSYGPLPLFVLFNLVLCVFLFCGYYSDPPKIYHSKEFLIVLLYPFFYGMLYIIAFLSHVHSIWEIERGAERSFSWWMAQLLNFLHGSFPLVLGFVLISYTSLRDIIIRMCEVWVMVMNADVNGGGDEKTE